MAEKRSLYANWALWLSLGAAIVATALYIVFEAFNLPVQITIGITFIAFATSVVLDPQRYQRAISGRQARYGFNMILMVVAFLGILAVFNYLVYQYPKRWDLTEGQIHTLTQETLDTLASLEDQVIVQAFYTTPSTPEESSRLDNDQNLLEDYKFFSDGKFSYEFIDPNQDPVTAENANVTVNRTVIVKYSGSEEKITFLTEQELTSALIRLISAIERSVYFLTGHGEYPLESGSEGSYSMLKDVLERKNYVVEELNLLALNEIPQDAAAVIVAGPLQPVSEEEVALLAEYVDGGGDLIVLEDPVVITNFGNQPDPLAEYLSTDWGIILGQDVIIDWNSFLPPYFVVWYEYTRHAITNDLLATAFDVARSVYLNPEITGVTQVELIKSGPQSWAETNFDSLSDPEQIVYDEEEDNPGPVPLAVVAQKADVDARVVVIGNSQFAADGYFEFYGNGDLIINAIDWAVGQEELINLTPREEIPRLLVPPSPTVMNLLRLLSVIFIPGVVLVSGVVVWFIRRSKG